MDWDVVRHEFIWEGSLRDIYVLDTTELEWQCFLDALASWPYVVRYWFDGLEASPPSSVADVFARRAEHSPLLSLRVGSIDVNCHFFSATEIELDLDPREVTNQCQLDELLDFLRRFGRAVNRTVVVTPENMREAPFLTYTPVADSIAYSRVGPFNL